MKKILVILFGVAFIGVGIFSIMKGNDLAKRCTAEAIGTVVEIVEEQSTDTDNDGTIQYTYYPVIEYTAGDKIVSKQSSSGSNPSKYNVNDKVDLLYDPNNVEDYIIKGDNSLNIFGIVFIVVGIVVILLGIIKRF